MKARAKVALRSLRRRRGSVLLLAIGVLGILSISALAYVTIVRLDRSSAAQLGRRAGYQQQADTVANEIQALLTADLFGNKIVTPDVPDDTGQVAMRTRPSMFEDGETWDSPSVHIDSLSTQLDPSQLPPPTSLASLPPRGVAAPDDAWLASSEPRWNPSVDQTRDFAQISNLRSAYRWQAGNASSTNDDRWVRGDGRFVDLAQWFLRARGGFADASINLLDWTSVSSTGERVGPELGNSVGADAAASRVDYDVFDKQMNQLSTSSFSTLQGPVAPSDERRWVDTDGDLRPDARWTVLDSLGNLGGLNWVVAARIVDASALVNLNSAIEFGPATLGALPSELADGSTPADVDLVRVLRQSAFTSAFTAAPRTDQLLAAGGGSFAEHLRDGIGVPAMFADLYERNPGAYPDLSGANPASFGWTPQNVLSQYERRVVWEVFGQAPLRPLSRQARGYPVRDMSDLMSFWGTNNTSAVSRVEQYIDGPEGGGYLPILNDPDPTRVGPLRAKETASTARRLISTTGTAADARPTLAQLRDSARRFITTVSGSGTQSPVPALALFGKAASSTRLEKVRVDRFLNAEVLKQAFASFVWALAPLSTNIPMHAEFLGSDRQRPLATQLDQTTGASSSDDFPGGPFWSDDAFHYGGGVSGPAQRLYGTSPAPGSTYAVLTAAQMAVNLADAIDPDTAASVVRFYDAPEPPATSPASPDDFSRRLPQGDIPEASLKVVAGTEAEPWIIAGMDNQLFLRECATYAFYRENPGDASLDNGVIGDLPAEQIGSAIVVQVENPWGIEINVSGISAIIPETRDWIDDPLITLSGVGAIVMDFPTGASATLKPYEIRSYVWVYTDSNAVSEWTTNVRDGVLARLLVPPGGTATNVESAEELTDARVSRPSADPVPFHTMSVGAAGMPPQPRPVLLMRNTIQGRVLIDRMSPVDDAASNFPPQLSLTGSAGFDLAGGDLLNNYGGGAGAPIDSTYFTSLGYNALDYRLSPANYRGQVVVSGSLTRPSTRPTSGFPGFVIERGPERDPDSGALVPSTGKNVVKTRHNAQAWLVIIDPINDFTPAAASIVSPQDLLGIAPVNPYVVPGDQTFLLTRAKADADANLPVTELPSFQLFVPSSPLRSPSEVLSVCPVAHVYRERTPGGTSNLDDLRNWRTAGEQLGLSLKYDHRRSGGAADLNPFLGTLDFSRFIPGQMGSAVPTAFPETLKIPLALRVPDCFEALPVRDPLAQGRVNINTAPRQVLSALPLIDPPYNVTDTSTGALLQANNASPRPALIEQYRDQRRGPPSVSSQLGMMPGVRDRVVGTGRVAAGYAGFTTPAETAMLGGWDVARGVPLAGQPDSFLALASDALGADGSPLTFRGQGAVAYAPYADATYNAVDDAEEMSGLYRAISNIATARSDVFIAWFVIRGYDPQVIEQIPVAGPSEADALNAMDNPDHNFRPAYESRWLVVFDRSQTQGGSPLTRATDRPRVLLQVELPISAE